MPIPTPVAEVFVNNTLTTFSLAGTAYTGVVINGGFDHEVGVDDMTNGGFYIDVNTNAKATFNLTVGWPTSGGSLSGSALAITGAPVITEGGTYAVIFDNPNGPYFSGLAKFNKSGNPIFDRKAGTKITYNGTSFGSFTRVNPSPGT